MNYNNSYLNIGGGNLLSSVSKGPNPGLMNCDQLANSESSYQTIKMNVDNLKMIQLGITLTNEEGMSPASGCTWQFNFKFDLNNDTYLKESISLLEVAGIDFHRFNHEGIDVDYFAENFISSGIVLNDKIKWITFHGVYDLAYLLRTLSNQPLPDDEATFLEYLNIYFPHFYDLRCMIKKAVWLKGSLNRIAADLDVERIGQTHQAGSDSLVTSRVFFKLIQHYNEYMDLHEDKNKLFGCENFTNLKSNSDDNIGNNVNVKNNQYQGVKYPGAGTTPLNPSNSNNYYSIYNHQMPKTNMYYNPNPYNAFNPSPNLVYPPSFPPNNVGYEYAYYPNPYYAIRK
jgi:CCR4-NOT transcription complex subunit 7/8